MIFSHFSSKIKKNAPLNTLLTDTSQENISKLARLNPEYPPCPQLMEAMEHYVRDSSSYRESPNTGFPALRELLSIYAGNKSPLGFENIMLTNGINEAVRLAVQSCLNPGDETLIFTPHPPQYTNIFHLVGATIKIVKLDEDEAFFPDISALKTQISPRTKMIVFSNPQYPSGVLWDKETLSSLVNLAKEKNIILLSDESFSEFVYEGVFVSLAEISPDYEHCIITRGLSTGLCMPYWLTGYLLGHQELIKHASMIQESSSGSLNPIIQQALIEAWEQLPEWRKNLASELDERRSTLLRLLGNQHGFRTVKPQAGLTCFTNIRYYLGNEVGGSIPTTSHDFTNIVSKKTGVILEAGTNLGMDGFFQSSFSLSIESLADAMRRIASILESAGPK